jgi:hypothetical protein
MKLLPVLWLFGAVTASEHEPIVHAMKGLKLDDSGLGPSQTRVGALALFEKQDSLSPSNNNPYVLHIEKVGGVDLIRWLRGDLETEIDLNECYGEGTDKLFEGGRALQVQCHRNTINGVAKTE